MTRTRFALLLRLLIATGALIASALVASARAAAQEGNPTPTPGGMAVPTRSPQLVTLANRPTTVEDVAAILPAAGACAATGEALASGETATGQIDNASFARVYCIEAESGDIITASMTRTDGDLDPVLLLLDESGASLAGNDDAGAGSDAYLEHLIDAPEAAAQAGRREYLLVATRYAGEHGATAGKFALTLTVEKAPEMCDAPGYGEGLVLEPGDDAAGQIDANDWFDVFCFDGESGDLVRVTMTATSGDLDSFLIVTDAAVEVEIARSDDRERGVYDAQIDALRLTEAGRYVILAQRFGQDEGDTRGEFELSFEVLEKGTPGVIYLPFDRNNSGSLREDGSRDRFLYPGDSEDNRAFKAFITFNIPTAWAEQGVESAGLALTGCMERGDAFAKLGALVVELVAYDALDTADFSAPAQRALAKLGACPDAPIDVTGLVRAAAEGDGRLQLRLSFAQIDADDATDDAFIQNQPVLEVRLGSQQCATEDFGAGQLIRYGDVVTGTITNDTWYNLYCFTAEAGDLVTVTMRNTSGDLDPLLDVFDMTVVEEIAWNDDADGRDAEARAFRIPEAGQYAIFATRYDLDSGETTGDYELTLTRARPGAEERADHVARYLSQESGGVSASGQVYDRVLAGDDETDQPIEGLISFDLTGLPAEAKVARAQVAIAGCDGAAAFEAFGALRIEMYDYGFFDAGDYGGQGGAMIAEFTVCPDAPLDVTKAVVAARAAGKDWLQLRLYFPAGSDQNGASIVLSLYAQPYLLIDLE